MELRATTLRARPGAGQRLRVIRHLVSPEKIENLQKSNVEKLNGCIDVLILQTYHCLRVQLYRVSCGIGRASAFLT